MGGSSTCFLRPVLDDFFLASRLGRLLSWLFTKYYSLAYLGSATSIYWVYALTSVCSGGVGAWFRCVLAFFFDGASAREFDRIVGGFFDGPEGHAVLFRHPA